MAQNTGTVVNIRALQQPEQFNTSSFETNCMLPLPTTGNGRKGIINVNLNYMPNASLSQPKKFLM